MNTLVNIGELGRVAVTLNGQRVGVRDGRMVRFHPHHWTCTRCNITREASSQTEAHDLAVTHGHDVHGVDVEPVLTNSVCTACAAMNVN